MEDFTRKFNAAQDKSASYGVANALEQGHMDLLSVVVEPLMEILLSLLLGAVAGLHRDDPENR